MNWMQVLPPTEETFEQALPLLKAAYTASVDKFEKKTAKR